MPITYTQINVHFVFVVKFREKLVAPDHQEELQKYLAGIVTKKGQKPIAISCMPDHTHLFVGVEPNISLSDLARDLKNYSSRFINQKKWIKGKFHWQKGFGAFSYGQSQIGKVVNYIKNQDQHHAHRSLETEYVELLEKFEVPFEDKYLW